MIKCLNTIFCKKVKVEDDGTTTLWSIFTGFSPPRMPARIKLSFVCFLELAINKDKADINKEFDLRVIIEAPWGRAVDDSHQGIIFQQYTETIAKCMAIIDYEEIIFSEFGTYSFEVYINEEHLYTAILHVSQENRN